MLAKHLKRKISSFDRTKTLSFPKEACNFERFTIVSDKTNFPQTLSINEEPPQLAAGYSYKININKLNIFEKRI